MTNCPNCGAPITSHQCEYCGTIFNMPKLCSHDDIFSMYKNAERLLVSGVVTINEARELCGLSRINTDIPEWRAPLSPLEAYKQGEIVRYCGVLRRSLVNRNIFTPIHDSFWETVYSI